MQALSPRLLALADLVPPEAKLIDVGTDHAYLPLWLIHQGRISAACASDIATGPLTAAADHARAAGLEHHLRLVQCDGLAAFGPEDGDVIVLAGMGGETIANILAAAPWICRIKWLLLQPMSKQAYLRQWLQENGIAIRKECLAQERDKIYNIIAAEPGEMPPLSPGERQLGIYALIREDPLFPAYFARYLKKLRRIVAGISEAAAPEQVADASVIRAALEEWEALSYREVELL